MQMTLFDLTREPFEIKNDIRLIELFAGVGSQAMALRNLGANFTHWKAIEFDKYAMASYNAIHGTNFEPTDIRDIHGKDLEITDTYIHTYIHTYILTYSFPCQDLSISGLQKGMSKGSQTRSGLLWEVERLLCEVEELPQVLVMENVPMVHSLQNLDDFEQWIEFLNSKGYTSYYEDLNASDYGVAQNRERTFMVSLLGNYNYKFPAPMPLNKIMKDYLEESVDSNYYVNSQKALDLIKELEERSESLSPTIRGGGRGSIDRHEWDMTLTK